MKLKKYKITQKGKFYYVYYRIFIFWFYHSLYSNLEQAKKAIEFLELPEVEIK